MTLTFYYFTQASMLIPMIIGFKYLRVLNFSTKVILFYLIASLSSEVLAVISMKLFGNNLIIYGTFNLLSFLILFLAYEKKFDESLLKKILWLIAIIIFIGIFVDFIFIKGSAAFLSESLTISYLFLSIVIVSYLIKLLKDTEKVRIESVPFFWISIGLLLFFASSMLPYFALNYLPEVDMRIIWPITWATAIIRNILIAIGFYLSGKQWNQVSS